MCSYVAHLNVRAELEGVIFVFIRYVDEKSTDDIPEREREEEEDEGT